VKPRTRRLKTLKSLSNLGVTWKRRISADAFVIMMEDIAADDWHEQLLVTITGVKTVFEQTKMVYSSSAFRGPIRCAYMRIV
jgi:hypothetical protein